MHRTLFRSSCDSFASFSSLFTFILSVPRSKRLCLIRLRLTMDFADGFILFVRVFCSVSSLLVILSPITMIMEICREKHTGPHSVIPLAAMFAAYFVWMMYGLLSGDIFPLFVTYCAGVLLGGSFLAVYLRYSKEKKRVLFYWGLAIAAEVLVTLFVVIGYTVGADSVVKSGIGFIGSCGSIVMYAAPFATLKKVFESKDASYIPIHIVIAGIIVNAAWTLYGVLVFNAFLIVPSVFGLVFSVAQVFVYLLYRHHNQRVLMSPSLSQDMLEAGTTTQVISLTPHSVQQPPPQVITEHPMCTIG